MQGFPFPIITYQVITGNYSRWAGRTERTDIITYQVITGNYSRTRSVPSTAGDYNIPSNNRELQRASTIREAYIIITYQVITGNYSLIGSLCGSNCIITYQVITGNYSSLFLIRLHFQL